jgi:hypothetical protein
MADRFERLLQRIREQVELQPIALAPDLAAAEGSGRAMQLRSYNWRASQFSKITVMQSSVEIPPMDQLNAIFYPDPGYDFPIFLFLTVVTKSHVIAIYNVNCPFTDNAYKALYIDPLMPVYERYAPFEGRERYPDWFEKYRNPATIFGVFPIDQLDDLMACALDYLRIYLRHAKKALKVEDTGRLGPIERFHEQFKEDIRTKDRGRWVLAKLMSDEYARRVFYEVAT